MRGVIKNGEGGQIEGSVNSVFLVGIQHSMMVSDLLVQCGVVCSACLSGLHEVSQHDNGGCVLFPDHLPEVSHRLLQRTLRRDVLLCSLVALRWGGMGEGE